MSKREGILIIITSFLTGVVVRFLISPIKQGIGNNSGNNYHYYNKEEEK